MIVFGSARIDEKGNLTGGKAGDQKQISVDDYKGEVSMQEFYVHKKGWLVLRLKDPVQAEKCAKRMIAACNNIHIGYDQGNRLGVVLKGIDTKEFTECDCSSLVRQCVKEATGKDPGNFNTSTEPTYLINTGLFEPIFTYTKDTPIYEGDILVTKTKGHTGVICYGNKRKVATVDGDYYPAYTGNSTSIVDALKAMGIDASKTSRARLAEVNNICSVTQYTGSVQQNIMLLALAKTGKLRKS